MVADADRDQADLAAENAKQEQEEKQRNAGIKLDEVDSSWNLVQSIAGFAAQLRERLGQMKGAAHWLLRNGTEFDSYTKEGEGVD